MIRLIYKKGLVRLTKISTKILSRNMENVSTLGFFETEDKFRKEGFDFVIGIDEAGRGPLAGPVVACACVLENLDPLPGASRHPLPQAGEGEIEKFKLIRDSKTLSEKQREKLYDFILENFRVGVGVCNHKTIDRINILEATFLAMKKALSDLKIKSNDKQIILVDGNKTIPNISVRQEVIINGDKFIKSISAASIVAKVTRDRMMHEAHGMFPEYGFSRHKGYGTAFHREMIKKHGPCEIHRKSFKLV